MVKTLYSQCGYTGFIPYRVEGTKIPHARSCDQKKKKKRSKLSSRKVIATEEKQVPVCI